jgi:hypothetical protein
MSPVHTQAATPMAKSHTVAARTAPTATALMPPSSPVTVSTPWAAAALAQLRAWGSVMLATLGRAALRLNHVRRSAECGKPPGGVAAGHVTFPAGRSHNGTPASRTCTGPSPQRESAAVSSWRAG